MNDYIKIFVVAIVGCLLISFVKEIKKEYYFLITLSCGVVIISLFATDLKALFYQIRGFTEITDINSSAIKIFFKAIVISVFSRFACEICNDTNNRFMSYCVELAGKTAILLTSLPLVSAVLKIVSNYIGA